MRYSMASVTGGAPTKLVMLNRVYSGWSENITYTNTNQWQSPKNSYFLTAANTEYFNEWSSQFAASDTIYFAPFKYFSLP